MVNLFLPSLSVPNGNGKICVDFLVWGPPEKGKRFLATQEVKIKTRFNYSNATCSIIFIPVSFQQT